MCSGWASNLEPLAHTANPLPIELSGRHPIHYNIPYEQPFGHDICSIEMFRWKNYYSYELYINQLIVLQVCVITYS